jgi:hypothetical protein
MSANRLLLVKKRHQQFRNHLTYITDTGKPADKLQMKGKKWKVIKEA